MLLPINALGQSKTPLPVIVIIIDDMANNLDQGEQALQLPGAINYAFLPHHPNTRMLATRAHQLHKEVLLHAPMSNVHNKPLGDGALTPQMEQQEFIKTLEADIASVPYAQGVNNHMGSLLTQMPRQMGWVMTTLQQHQLYFIDSRTSVHTAAESIAALHQLPHLRRHIFLDNQRSDDAIDAQFEKLLQLANTQAVTVAIGHPYPETIAVLEKKLPSLQLRGYRLALASEVVQPSSCKNEALLQALLINPCPQHPPTQLAFRTQAILSKN